MSDQKTASNKKAKPILCVVTSDKMDKSRVGTIDRLVKDKRYMKYIRQRTRLMFHDESNQTSAGDKVLIIPSRPYSSRKKFDLLKVVQKAGEA